MWISGRTAMELIERLVHAENRAAAALERAEEAEKQAREAKVRCIALQADVDELREKNSMKIGTNKNPMGKGGNAFWEEEKTGEEASGTKMLEELLNGVPDEKTGRVKLTDGRE